MEKIYNQDTFDELISRCLSHIKLLKEINSCFNDGTGQFRENCWAYAGEILWCRDIYGRYYKINELVSRSIQWYEDHVVSSELYYVLSKLYMILLMIHPFENANGRTIFTFISILAYSNKTILQVPILSGTNRIHESFREVEHNTYSKLIARAIELLKQDKLKIDKRIKVGYNIGNFDYTSFIFILFKMNDDELYDEMIEFLRNSTIERNEKWIRYLD